MATTKCRDCEQQVSDDAIICPNCGAPNPAHKCTVVVKRKKKIMGAAQKIHVEVEGNRMASLGIGEVIEFQWLHGNCSIAFWSLGNSKRRINVQLSEDKVTHVTVESAVSFAKPKVEIEQTPN